MPLAADGRIGVIVSSTGIIAALERYARACHTTLPPHWDADLRAIDLPDNPTALETVRTQMDWDRPKVISGRPQPDEFPLLVHDPEMGWVVARQWIGEGEMALAASADTLTFSEEQIYCSVQIPDPLRENEQNAFGIFADS